MKVSGFTIVRNAIKYDYPVVESVKSILPLCDEVIVSVGNSEDDTLALIQSIASPKIKVVHSVWDDSLREGGRVLAVETNKAKQHIAKDADWCIYIQADEVLHEDGYDNLLAAMREHKDKKHVDGLLLNYRHFYGSYEYVADAYNWYRKEIRVIRNQSQISSWGDAQGFRKYTREESVFWDNFDAVTDTSSHRILPGTTKACKLQVKPVDVFVHHYGWVKDPQAQQRKQESFHKMWHNDEWMEQHIVKANEFDYNTIDSLQKFSGTHPQVMQERIARQNWKFEFDTTQSRMKLKYRLRRFMENTFGINIGEYRNYELV